MVSRVSLSGRSCISAYPSDNGCCVDEGDAYFARYAGSAITSDGDYDSSADSDTSDGDRSRYSDSSSNSLEDMGE